MKRILLAAAIAAVGTSAWAQAAPTADPMPAATAFFTCDGYGEPSRSGDGMTSYAGHFGFPGTGDRRRVAPKFGAAGVTACQAALARLAKYPDYWLRKVSLLRGSAMHRVAVDDTKGALADLDAAMAAAANPADPYYERSLKLGADLVRALALRWSGDQGGAEALVTSTWLKRPYSRQVSAAASIVIGRNADFERVRPILTRLAQLDPNGSSTLFQEAFEHGRFKEALELLPSVTPPLGIGDEPMQFRQRVLLEQDNRAMAEAFWVDALGRKAYALAALERDAEARAALAAAKARMDAATPDLAPLPGDAKSEAMTRMAVYEQTNLKIRQALPPIHEQWSRLTEARLLLNAHKLAESGERATAGGQPLPGTYASIDLIDAVSRQDESLDPQIGRNLRASLAKMRQSPRGEELAGLFRTMPEAETAKRAPRYNTAGLGILTYDGYKESHPAGQSFTTVGFNGYNGTLALMEEAALLRAADLAAQAGKDAVKVVGRHDIELTQITTYYGVPTRSDPTGFETKIDVDFVNAAATAAAERWKLLDVEALRADLAPYYRPDKTPDARKGK